MELTEATMTTPRATQRALLEVRPDDITTDYAVSEANEQWGRGRLSPPPTLSIICVMSGGPRRCDNASTEPDNGCDNASTGAVRAVTCDEEGTTEEQRHMHAP